MLLAVTAVFGFSALLLGYILWIKSSRRAVDVRIPDGAGIEDLYHSIAALSLGHVIEGNRVEVIQDSSFFDALLTDVAAARHHIHLETFLWRDGTVSDRVSSALIAAAGRGVEVRVLVDQRGAAQTDPTVWANLRRAGCDFRVYHRARFSEFAWYNHRDHRKIAVIDRQTGYTFGHGIADMWGGSPEHPHGWRDTAARIQGPAVLELQTAFFDNWVRTSGVAQAGPGYFHPTEPAGSTPIHLAYLTQRETTSSVQRLYYLAIAAAREEIILQNPYFIPDRRALRLFSDAASRGVSIRIMLPTAATSDFPIVQHASHLFYGPLLAFGAKVYEYTRSGLHQKVMIIDRKWCSVGSTNFDPRSFKINDEITIGIFDANIAETLRAAFDHDLGDAREWTLAMWNRRSPRHQLVDRISSFARWQL